jgi:uncharacterized protein
MPEPWSRPLEVDRLADGGADLDFAVPLAELSGLRPLRADLGGSVQGRVHFRREAGIAVAELALEGAVTLQCQRCMKPMELPLRAEVRVGLIAREADVARVPADLEPMLAPGGRVSLGEIITEELLLSLPLVPLHPESARCGTQRAATAGAQREGERTQKPFAQLAELLKRQN